MRKILLVVALIVGLCLSTVVGNCASFSDTDVVRFTGNTGKAELTVQEVSFHFSDIQPGERLAVTWWIKNDGPCPLAITVDVWLLTGDSVLGNSLTPVFYPGYTLQMGPGLWRNVALTVQMDANAPNSTADKPFTVRVTFHSTADGTRYENPGHHAGGWK